MSIRQQQIIDAIKSRFGDISQANGYFTDAGATIDEWHELPITDLPKSIYHLDIKDTTEKLDSTGEDGPLSCWNRTLTVKVEHTCATNGTDDAMTVLGKMVADTVKAVGVDQSWGGLAISTEIEKGKPDAKQSENKFASQASTLTIKYQTAPGSPDDTPIVGSVTISPVQAGDLTTAIVKAFQMQAGGLFGVNIDFENDSIYNFAKAGWFWHVLPFMRTELPVLDIRHEDNATVAETVDGPINQETRLLPIKSTIMYSGKGNLSTLRTQKEVFLTAIEADRTLGGLVLDCLPTEVTWAMNHEETMILGITITHNVLHKANKWEN